MNKYITGLICLLAFAACTPKDALLEYALQQAGDNRAELEKVLDRYRNSDEEKYRAACFLIRNMPFYGTYEGKELEKYYRYFKMYSLNKDRNEQELVDSLVQADGPFYIGSLTKRKDIETVDSAFLATHIDWAFKVWREQPWGKNVSYEDFCEYILPYRMMDEPLSLWRETFYKQYNSLLDSLRDTPGATDPLQAAQVVLTHMSKQKYQSTTVFPFGPYIGPQILEWRVGYCQDFAAGIAYVCRALGIPCGTDHIMLWTDNYKGHSWNFTLDKDGKTYAIDFPYTKRWKESTDYYPLRKGKVYRVTFSLNEDMMRQWRKGQTIHPTFYTPFFRDVTAAYLRQPNQSVEIPKENLMRKPKKGEAVYLCVSNKQDWEPVDCTVYKGENIRFGPVEGNMVCIAGTWNGQSIQPVCNPFYIDTIPSNIHFYQPEEEKQTVDLFLKFCIAEHKNLHARLLGGVIEGSNRRDFKHTDTLYIIREAPFRRFTEANLKIDKPYRYIRYRVANGSRCHIAELSIYGEDTIPLQGRVIGTPSSRGRNGRYEYTNVFDGNTETSFDYTGNDTGWAGLDFGKPIQVKKAVYTPANRVNFIYKGYDYELFYWGDGHWNSLGRQTATADSLVYEAPVNALLYLKCYTEGKDERIFEYKDGKQIFR